MSVRRKDLNAVEFIWPQVTSGTVALTPAQLSMLLEGRWRRPVRSFDPQMSNVRQRDFCYFLVRFHHAVKKVRYILSNRLRKIFPISINSIQKHLKSLILDAACADPYAEPSSSIQRRTAAVARCRDQSILRLADRKAAPHAVAFVGEVDRRSSDSKLRLGELEASRTKEVEVRRRPLGGRGGVGRAARHRYQIICPAKCRSICRSKKRARTVVGS